MMGHAIDAVHPGRAHRASLGLPLSIHQVIDDERAIRPGEEFAETDSAQRRVSSVEVARALFKLIVLNRSALRELPTQLSDPLALAHEFNFCKAKFLTLGQILGRLIS